MSEWKDKDEVTTTYGSIQLSLKQAHAAGIKTEQERIIKLLEENTGCGYQHRETEMCFCEAIALIKGESNE